MIIITLPKDKSKEIIVHLSTLKTNEERTAYLQKIYNRYMNVFYNKVTETLKRMVSFRLEDGSSATGKARFNGWTEKTLSPDGESTYVINVRRLRCDSLHICQEIFINLLIPYSRLLVGTVIMFLHKDRYANRIDEIFSPFYVDDVIKKWALWKKNVNETREFTCEEDLWSFMNTCPSVKGVHFFQFTGRVSFVYYIDNVRIDIQ